MTPRKVFELIQAWDALPWDSSEPMDRQKASFANEIQWFSEYADGREAPMGIVAADWNDREGFDIPSRLCAILEKMGVEIEWRDCVSTCGDCGGCIQTEPDHWGWQPAFIVTDGDIFCAKCAADDAETLLEKAEGGVWNMPDIDPTDHGYVSLPEEYQTGWHPGQTDDPKKVLAALKEKGITRALIVIDDVGQFDSKWRVFLHESETDESEEKAV